MEDEKQTTALTDLIAGVKTEMELLYHVEKEISSLKESVESFKTVKEEVKISLKTILPFYNQSHIHRL